MRLQTRLGLAATVVIGAVSLGISYSALMTASASEVSRLGDAISYVVDEAALTPEDALTVAMDTADASAVPLALGLLVDGQDLTALNDARLKLNPLPSASQLSAAATQPVEIAGSRHYLLRTLLISKDQYLLVATDLAGVDRNALRNRTTFAWWTFGGILLGGVVIIMLIRREIKVVNRLIRAADSISRGETEVLLADDSAATELVELSHSLSRMVQTLRHSLEVERETQLRLQRFLGDASHELRTPLTVVRGYAELLAEPDLSTEQRERAVARLTSESTRMEQLIRDLLLLSELGDGRGTSEPLDLSELVEDAVSDLQVIDPERHVTARVQPGIQVLGDVGQLRQLLANAVGNIRRHTPVAASVEFALALVDGEAELVIEDGGPGLSEAAYAAGIAEFQRFDPSRSRESGGSGLGMSIMASIVRRHGGDISLSPSRLGGLRIAVRLPLA